MVRYIKNGKVVSGYKLEKADGTIVLNAPEEMWLEEGWQKVEQLTNIDLGYNAPSFEELKQDILNECETYYETTVCEVMFNGELLWVPIETRTAYRLLLEDVKASGEETVEFKGVTLPIDQALAALASINAYCYQVSKVYNSHVAAINNLSTIQELEQYDYTANYPDNLVF